jgi:replicative DNA helicase
MHKPDQPTEASSPDAVEKYRTWEQKHEEFVNRATLMIAKQRHGSTGNVPMHFEREFTKFSDLAPGSWGDYE